MASIGGYRSPVNLGLGRVPQTSDPEQFDTLVEVFNSIHLIAAQLDNLRLAIGGGGAGQTPIETAPFIRFFPATALQPITAGNVVAPATGGANGVIKGALPHLASSTSPEANFVGIALDTVDTGDTVRVGIGPGVLEVPGAVSGNLIWGYSNLCTNGNFSAEGDLYLSNPGSKAVAGGTVYAMPIGVCIEDGYAIFNRLINRA